MTTASTLKHSLHMCPECGYSLKGLPAEGTCPECGYAYREGEFTVRGWPVPFQSFIVSIVAGVLVAILASQFHGVLTSFFSAHVAAAAPIVSGLLTVLIAMYYLRIINLRREPTVSIYITQSGVQRNQRGVPSARLRWRDIPWWYCSPWSRRHIKLNFGGTASIILRSTPQETNDLARRIHEYYETAYGRDPSQSTSLRT